MTALGSISLASTAAAVQLNVGPTQTYTTIQAAINAASNGDLILVDAGTYPSFQISSSTATNLTIAAASGSFTLVANAGVSEIDISGVPLGHVVTVIGAHIEYADPMAPAVAISACPGAVRLSHLEVDLVDHLDDATVQAAVEVDDTATFWLINSSIWPIDVDGSTGIFHGNTVNPLTANGILNEGISALQMRDSEGTIQNSRMAGYWNLNNTYPSYLSYGGDGFRILSDEVESTAWFLNDEIGRAYRTSFVGGGGEHGGHAVHQVRLPNAQPTLNQSCGKDSPLYSLGPKTISSGTSGSFYGLNNNNGISNVPGLPPIYLYPVNCLDNQQNENSVVSNLVPIGGQLQIRLRSTKARKYLTYVSASTLYSFTLPPYPHGRGMLDPNPAFLVHQFTDFTLANTTKTVVYNVPNSTLLIGTQLTVQSINGKIGTDPQTGQPYPYDTVSLPALAVITGP